MNLPSAIALDENELDALTELANVGVSRAATSLRDMVGAQVHLSVPSVAVVTREAAVQILKERGVDRLVAVRQAFEGDLAGRALLIFPETNSLELVRAVTGNELPLEDIIELEQEALAETGNIILNSCLATMANMLHCSLKMSLPEVLRGAWQDFFDVYEGTEHEEAVLFLYISFALRQRDIDGYIAMLMHLPALEALKTLLGELIRRTAGGTE